MLQFWNKERSAKEYELKASKKWIVTSENSGAFRFLQQQELISSCVSYLPLLAWKQLFK